MKFQINPMSSTPVLKGNFIDTRPTEVPAQQESFLYIRAALNILKRYWYVFILSIALFTAIAFFINWYLEPLYEVSAVILIEENNGPVPDPSKEFMKSFSIFTPSSDIQQEILKMKSSDLIYNALRKTPSAVSYSFSTGLLKRELYSDLPFKVETIGSHFQPLDLKFQILPLGHERYRLFPEHTHDGVNLFDYTSEKSGFVTVPSSFIKDFSSGDTISNGFLSVRIIVNPKQLGTFPTESKFFFQFNDLHNLTYEYQKSIHIEQVSKDIQAASIKLKVASPQKGIDIINAVTAAYIQRNLDKKNQVAENTIHYFDNQLTSLEDSLKQAEERLQQFRSENKVMQIASKTDQVFKGALELENQKADLETKLNYYNYVFSNLEKNKDHSDILIPSSMGVNDMVLSGLISEYLKLNTEKNNLIKKNITAGPSFKNLSIELENQKTALSENIESLIQTTRLQLKSIEGRLGKGNEQIKTLPTTERQLVGIERNYRLNDNLVNYMLEKKAEAQVAKASNLSKNDILEPARLTQLHPVSPNGMINLVVALVVGLILPFTLIGTARTFNNKVDNNHALQELRNLPFLGNICHKKKKKESLVLVDEPNSAVAESIRGVRANLHYFLPGKQHKLILLTSTKPNEGKSFTSLNLAVSLALLGRKTVLMDFDLRKPNLYQSLQLPNTLGISSILEDNADLDDAIVKTTTPFLDFLPAGKVPAYPAELINSGKTEEMLHELKTRYDFVILDTPPVGLISEGLVLMNHADLKILVVRQGVTLKKELAALLNDFDSKDVQNLCWLLNDVDPRDTPFGKRNRYINQR